MSTYDGRADWGLWDMLKFELPKTVRAKAQIVGALVAVSLVLGTAASLRTQHNLIAALSDGSTTAKALRNHMTADMVHDGLRGVVYSALSAEDLGKSRADIDQDLEEYVKTIRTALAENRELDLTDQIKADLASAEKALGGYIEATTTISRLAFTDRPAALARIESFEKAFKDLEKSLETVGDRIEQETARIEAEATRLSNVDAIWSSALLITALLLVVAGTIYILMRVLKPIGLLRQDMDTIAGGNLTHSVGSCDRADEIGGMARSLVLFRDAAREKIEAERRAAEELAKHEAERQRTLQTAIEAERATVNASIGTAVARLAQKDLAYRIDEQLPEAYARLKDDFNEAVTQLSGAISLVSTSTEAIFGSAGELSNSSQELAGRTERQAASLEETAAALEEIAVTGKKMAQGAKNARTSAIEAAQDVAQTGKVVGSAMTAMADIETFAKQIHQIVDVIDAIAFQTSLLALNAAVESARAGEAGRGFAVVASEVRGLAQRSAQSAREIKDLVSNSSGQVLRGVGLVTEAGEALDRIVAKVSDMGAAIADIAACAEEQATGLEEVSAAVNHMDQITQQNAAMVEEATAACVSLTKETDGLQQLVAEFVFDAAEEDAEEERASAKRRKKLPRSGRRNRAAA